jgi:hypothetical protein
MKDKHKNVVRKPERYHQGDLGIDGRIILKCVLKNRFVCSLLNDAFSVAQTI